MDLEFSEHQYNKEISDLAFDLYDEALDQNDNDHELAMDAITDRMLHELIDGHQWVIYTYSSELVGRFSSNSEAYRDCYGDESIGQIVSEKGLDAIKPIIAFFAMYQDVMDAIFELETVKWA